MQYILCGGVIVRPLVVPTVVFFSLWVVREGKMDEEEGGDRDGRVGDTLTLTEREREGEREREREGGREGGREREREIERDRDRERGRESNQLLSSGQYSLTSL